MRPRRKIKTIDKDERAFTIHDSTTRPFTVQIPQKNKDDTPHIITKTTIVSFKNEEHAQFMSRLLEAHKAVNREWPSTLFDDNFSLHLVTWDTKTIVNSDELYIMDWSLKDLRSYCADHIIDMMYIKSIEDRKTSLSFQSDLYRIEMAHEFYVDKFSKMFRD